MEDKITRGKLHDLIQDDRNLNKGTERGQQLIEKSLREFGAGRSILLDKNNRIIAGNKTHKNAELAGLDDVIIVETDGTKLVAVKRTDVDLDTKQGREMALADNATTKADLSWDTEELNAVAEDFGIDADEWDVELDEMPVEPTETTEDDFDEEQDEAKPVAQRGDVFVLGEHRLMCGDSANPTDVERLMNGEKADLVFTDPPYGVSIGDKNSALNAATSFVRIERNIENDTLSKDDLLPILTDAMKNCKASCKDDASYYVTSPQGGELFMMMMMMRDAGLPVRHVLIWVKNMPTFSLGRLDYDYQHEPILYTWGAKHHNYKGGQFRTSVWTYDKPRASKLHPTMKPVELVANCINDGTLNGDLVLDLFGGSGTTMIAAEQLGRKCNMMELDPHYCDVIISRWEKLTGKKAVKVDGNNAPQPTEQ